MACRKWLLVTILCSTTFSISAQKTDKALEETLVKMTNGFKGQVGFYVKNLNTGTIAAYNADSIFPTASIVKVPILLGVMDKIEKGELVYHDKLTYSDTLFYAGEDILGSFKDGEKIELSKVIMLMCTTSDNTASLWLQLLAGTGKRINELLDSLNLPNTKVNSRTPGREEYRGQYGWGQTTPAEMATLFEMMVNRKVLNAQVSEKMLRILSRNYWDEEALSVIPPGVFVASKNGAVDASRSEVLYVNGKKTPYLFAIFTKNNEDRSWEANNEAWVMTRRMSDFLWTYFNGD